MTSPKPKGMDMKIAQRDLLIATTIAEDVLGWEWKTGGWYNGEEFQTDYFDPMNDPKQVDQILKSGLDIKLKEENGTWTATAPNTDKETTGINDDTLIATGSKMEFALCFLLCMMVGDNPTNWK